MNIYTNDINSILFKDLIYNDFYDESDIIESIECTKDNVFVYVLGMNIDYDLLNNVECKKLIIDYSSNDCIQFGHLNKIKENVKREHKVISKSLDFKELNHLFYDQQMYRFKEHFRFIHSFNMMRDSFYETNLEPHKKGNFFVGHPRYHKLSLLNHLYLNKKLDDLYWASSDIDYDLPENVHWGLDILDREKEYHSFEVIKELPKKLDYNYETSEHHLVSIGITINWGFYLNSCFDIIGETNFYSDNFVHHISEKLLKPIMLGVPFVCLNLPNTISKLETNFGFDFSDEDFGHEYDSIVDMDKRLDTIKDKVSNLLDINKSGLKEISYTYSQNQNENRRILFEVFWKGSLKKIKEFIDE